MKRSEKILWIVAAGLFVLGGMLAAISLVMVDFDFSKYAVKQQLETEYEVQVEEQETAEKKDLVIEPKSKDTYEIQRINPIKGLVVKDVSSDITLLPAYSNYITIRMLQSDEVEYDVVLTKDDILTVTREEKHNSIHLGIGDVVEEMTIYLPVAEYELLKLKTVSGDMDVPAAFSFASAELITTSGDIDCHAKISNDISVKTTSGELDLENLYVVPEQTSIKVKSASGDITMKNIFGKNISVQTTSGEMELEQVRSNYISIKSTSGDLHFTESDFGQMEVETTSGDVSGDLNSSKNFEVKTTSGDVNVPQADTFRMVSKIKTTSGDINITINE